jgi:hypothetical protein
VIDETTFCDRFAVTVALLNTAGAKALQISAPPGCAFVRFTSAQVRPPPVTLVTVKPPDTLESAEMNASNSSLGTVVENAAVVNVVLGDVPSRDTILSIARETGGAVGVTVSVAFELVPYVPEIVTEVLEVTTAVVTVKVAEVAPDETVTFWGTCATVVLSLDSETTAPPAGAAPLSVTVPVEEVPPISVAGLSVRDARPDGLMVRAEDCVVA